MKRLSWFFRALGFEIASRSPFRSWRDWACSVSLDLDTSDARMW